MITDMTLKKGWLATNTRKKILSVEQSMKDGIADGTLDETVMPATEFYSDGCYGRQVMIPKGTALVGEIHATEWIIVVSRGKIRIVDESGTRIIDATKEPVTFISPSGVKRAGYALEDTWWTGFRATPLTNEADIRKEHLVDSYDKLENKQCG